MLRRTFVAAGVAALCALAGPALAQKFPDRAITIVVPYGPGGTNDIVAREVAQKMQEQFGQPVVVENKPGANGALGTGFVARAKPDGYTIGIAPSSVLAINEWLYKDLPYDVEKDLQPLSLAGTTPNILVVHPSVPANTIAEFVALAKSKPGGIAYASMGAGSTGHLNGELFKTLTGTDIKHIPYKGSGPALNDLLAGQVQAMFDNLSTALTHVKAGKLKGLGITSLERSPLAPEIPTVAATVKGFDATSWFGFVAPKGMPQPVLDALAAAIIKAMNAPDVRERLEKGGLTVVANKPEEFGAFIRAEKAKWGGVVKAANVKIEQ
ncbi:MAG: Bug family tripartite tricarboxylate transporter substrate binding protein [Reyranellaceae bacterium]